VTGDHPDQPAEPDQQIGPTPDAGRVASEGERIETTEENSGGFDTPPPAATGPTEPAEPAEPDLAAQLAERTADLQRLQAEYINYKRRVDRDRELVRAQGKEAVLQSLLTVLDDLARADQHGELTGGFKAVADSLHDAVKGHNLEPFGAVGDPFDPNLHEAVAHAGTSTDVTVQSIDAAMRAGYRIGERILRHAVVSVVDPADAEPEQAADEQPTAQ